jgi:hypothetical protein
MVKCQSLLGTDIDCGVVATGVHGPAMEPFLAAEFNTTDCVRLRLQDLQELSALKLQRPRGLPLVRVVVDMPQSDQWAAVSVELPFGEANAVLGEQLDRIIVPGIWVNHATPSGFDGTDLSDYSD